MDENALLEFLKNWFKNADPEVNYAEIADDGSAILDGGWDLARLASALARIGLND